MAFQKFADATETINGNPVELKMFGVEFVGKAFFYNGRVLINGEWVSAKWNKLGNCTTIKDSNLKLKYQ